MVGESAEIVLEILFVEKVGGGGHTHEQPGLAPELILRILRPLFGVEHPAEVGPHGSNPRACGQHDDIGLFINR